MNPKDLAAECRAPMHLLPAITAIEGAMACRQGAIEYGSYNWREKPISLMKYLGALERHIAKLKDGEWTDKKSGRPHFAHIIATSGILLDANECDTLMHDWPKQPGHASEALDIIEEELKDEADTTGTGEGGSASQVSGHGLASEGQTKPL